ncbi:MAG: phytanoyl-CoA dioxygenase family protein [Hyphomicrobiaceae bacterium]
MNTAADYFARDGVAILPAMLGREDLSPLEPVFEAVAGGARQFAIDRTLVRRLQEHEGLARTASYLQGEPARLVRVVAFDKTPEANWFVPWHQDRTIAVTERRTVPGYDRWTRKDGCCHVEPPVILLERMVTLRIHFDRCTLDDGPLEVVCGSHLGGRLDKPRIARLVAADAGTMCLAERGDIVAMRPLIVHRSQRAKKPTRRRVLHLEYAAAVLPDGMTWALAGQAA